jgi:hypothetical protein
MGPYAGERAEGNNDDGDEDFRVTHDGGVAGAESVTVTAFGVTQVKFDASTVWNTLGHFVLPSALRVRRAARRGCLYRPPGFCSYSNRTSTTTGIGGLNGVLLSKLVVERCKRLAERGQDVLLLIDSLTRMARAFNKSIGNSGRTMSGGLNRLARFWEK